MQKKISLLFFITIFSFSIFGLEIEVIKNPKPTCFEKKEMYTPLKVYKMIRGEDGDDENFLGEASQITADSSGNIYIFDRVFTQIFKYDKNLNFKKRFGGKGKGPGEFALHRSSFGAPMRIVEKKLYAQDYRNRRISVFSLDGDYIDDIKIDFKYSFIPEIDMEGNLYIPSLNGGIVDIYNSKMKLMGVLLDDKEFQKFLFKMPNFPYRVHLSYPHRYNFYYSLLKDNRFIIYILNSSTVYFLENRKLKNKYHIWPEKVLKSHKKDVDELEEDSFVNIAVRFFIDEDDNDFFYIQFGRGKINNIVPLYKFNLKGRLEKIFYIKGSEGSVTFFKCKKNDIFYAIIDDNVVLYKNELEEK